jgi:RND superfamily putative drug exporter
MLRRATPRGVFAGAGLPALGRLIVRHPVLMIVAWVVLAAVLFLTLPPLAEVAQKKPPGLLPDESSVMVAGREMGEAFSTDDGGPGGGNSENVGAVILTNEHGLTPDDEVTYRTLVERLKADTENVLSTQDFVTIPELRQVMTSEDGKAWQLPISMQGTMGTGKGQAAFVNVANTVNEVTANTALTANVLGPAATFDDLNKIGVRDQLVIEIATVLIVLTILIMVYRNLVAMILPMLMIGVVLAVAQSVVAGLGDVGILGLGPQTFMLMTAMAMGAGVDYAIFLFSRYHECVRTGLSSDDAIVAALGSIGKVIAGSAGTVAITFLGLAFTKLGAFSTVGPALSVTVAIAFLASVTLLPALVVLAGRRRWVKPRKDLTGRFWRKSGVHIVRAPKVHLAISLVILIGLACCSMMIKYNYDDRKNLPADSVSNMGYEAMNKHFPVSSMVEQFILIQSPQDLRSPKALADMEQMAARVSQLPDIALVRGITRPTGEVLEQAKATWQAGEVGGKLRDASTLIATNDANLNMLSGGSHQLADTLDQLRNGVVSAVITVRPLAIALADMQQKFGGSKTLAEVDKTATLVANMRSLGKAVGVNTTRITDIYGWATPMLVALNASPACSADPACVASRADLQRITAPQNAATVKQITELGRQLEGTDDTQTLDETLEGLGKTMDGALEAANQLGLNDPNSIEQQLASVEQGANLLADSSRMLAQGTQLLVDQTKAMGGGLDQASAFLLAMKREAANPPMSGFYIPPEILTQPEFKKAASLFVSADGHAARFTVQTALNPFDTGAMDQVQEIIKTAESARPNTTLADAKISLVGFSAMQNDIRNYYNADIQFIIVVTLIVVFLILVVLLRSFLAPIYLVGSVILSYMSALGIGVVFFQFLLGQQISWSVPGMTFLVLVAVGADYNLLLISRIRDEADLGIRTGVIRTVGATGGVITSAGLIFAASMMGLTFSSLAAVVQIGFIIGVGLLLDTFLVRTITVPATAVLLGKANWWPSKTPPGEERVRLRKLRAQARAKAAAAAEAEADGDAPAEKADDKVLARATEDKVLARTAGDANLAAVAVGGKPVRGRGRGRHYLPLLRARRRAGRNGVGLVTHEANGELVVETNGEVAHDTNGEVVHETNGEAAHGTNGVGAEATNGAEADVTNGGEVETDDDVTADVDDEAEFDNEAAHETNGDAAHLTNGGSAHETNGGATHETNGGFAHETNGGATHETNGGAAYDTDCGDCDITPEVAEAITTEIPRAYASARWIR